jgi:hypothetical protein
MTNAHPSDQLGCVAFSMNHDLIRCHVERQVLLVKAPEDTEVGTEHHACFRVGIAGSRMSILTILITWPFAGTGAWTGWLPR